ncbi:hypothetical protein K6W21_23930 [Burkholderia latens]|uniref:hypothetical protein n=1 Tax=Burkholderia latens TaxID=488446 RepID=UPI001C98B6A8|nr:hypothetical protein [Burkholderia latens]MBY4697125.1 hypothetical protein [Burkholderia latens]
MVVKKLSAGDAGHSAMIRAFETTPRDARRAVRDAYGEPVRPRGRSGVLDSRAPPDAAMATAACRRRPPPRPLHIDHAPGCHDIIGVSAGSRGEPVIDRRPD